MFTQVAEAEAQWAPDLFQEPHTQVVAEAEQESLPLAMEAMEVGCRNLDPKEYPRDWQNLV